ncbi:MAG: phosphoribosyl-AMP cyclohydrolase [Nitrospirae bacterium]|nr:phosphoribosyl-AMP cyclohydrolase [Nitrospirota bacterium]
MNAATIRSLFRKQKLIPAVLQDARTREVLMLAYVNAQALRLTMETGWAHFYSRSRKRIWKKGETSGHVQRVEEIRYDCDEDTLLFKVRPAGPACHTGRRSCFFRKIRYTKAQGDRGAHTADLPGRRGGKRGKKPRRR